MFETSQPEASAGTAKIVGGVIAVVVVLLVAVWFLFLKDQTAVGPAATPAAGAANSAASTEPADPMKDLTISKSNLRRDQTQTMAMWDLVIQNRNRGRGYKNVRYATNYYNAQDAVIYHNEATLKDAVDPGDLHTFTSINDGLYPVGTARYTIELKGADPN